MDQIFLLREESPGNWKKEAELEGHENWVRDVAWSPSDSQTSTIASCGAVNLNIINQYGTILKDGRVIIWRCANMDSDEPKWSSRLLRKYDDRKF